MLLPQAMRIPQKSHICFPQKSHIYEELSNQGNLDAAEEIVTPDFVLHDPNIPEEPRGPEGLKQFVTMYRNVFPDLSEKVGTRWVA
jgi:predicted SnoaL-like aldol condensation-catalyzing enzyme